MTRESAPATATERKRLGRGLESLIESFKSDDAGELLFLAPESIDRNERNPRLATEEGFEFEELKRSIERHGILEPLVVRRGKAAGRHELLCGERRWRAAISLGLPQVPCVRLEVPDERVLEVMLVENLHREDLDPIATAKAYRALLEEHDYTQEALAERVAKSRPAITNALRLLELPENLQARVAEGAISPGHARAIAGVKGAAEQNALAERVEREGLSVRETEAIVAGTRPGAPQKKPRGKRRERPAYLDMLEDRLRKSVGTKVAIEQTGPSRGRLVIDFYSDDEFERLLEFFS